jgi:ketosteroid isomerase-like protein
MAAPKILLVAVMVLLAGCNMPDDTKMKQEIQAHVKQFAEAAQNDVNAMLAMYEPGPSTVSIGNGEIQRGIEAIRKNVDANLVGSLGRFKYDLGSIEVTPLGTGFAVAVTPFVMTENAGSPFGRQLKGVSTSVWKKTESGWKVIQEHESMQL